jgi:putative ABC transport system ATP-binding protein
MANGGNPGRGGDAIAMSNNFPLMVRAEEISKGYRLSKTNKIDALKNVTLSIPRGQSAIIQGPSGSGKSTLLNLLGCLDRPSGGRIFYNGEEITDFSEEEVCRLRRTKIGFVFQQFHLLPRMTAWENASVALIPLGVSEKERFQRAGALLDQVGLASRILHRPEAMSGGEQQRVAIARALINDPELLLADEPTSNIDAASAQKVIELFAGLRSRGCTIVIATHDIDLFRRAHSVGSLFEVDAVYRLTQGRIEPARG